MEMLVGGGTVTGELVDAEVLVEVFEVVLLNPSVEHQAYDALHAAPGVVGEDGELDGFAVGVRGADDDLSEGGIFCPRPVDVFEAVSPEIPGVVAPSFNEF